MRVSKPRQSNFLTKKDMNFSTLKTKAMLQHRESCKSNCWSFPEGSLRAWRTTSPTSTFTTLLFKQSYFLPFLRVKTPPTFKTWKFLQVRLSGTAAHGTRRRRPERPGAPPGAAQRAARGAGRHSSGQRSGSPRRYGPRLPLRRRIPPGAGQRAPLRKRLFQRIT